MSIIQSLYGEEHEYKVNGATYIVSAAFKHTGIITEENDTMAAENVCSAAGKEDNIAVEEETG